MYIWAHVRVCIHACVCVCVQGSLDSQWGSFDMEQGSFHRSLFIVCVCVYLGACQWVCACGYMCVYTHTYMCTYKCALLSRCACTFVCVSECVFVCVGTYNTRKHTHIYVQHSRVLRFKRFACGCQILPYFFWIVNRALLMGNRALSLGPLLGNRAHSIFSISLFFEGRIIGLLSWLFSSAAGLI